MGKIQPMQSATPAMAAQVPTDPRLVAYVGTKRLAQLLDFSETTVRDLARRGEIPKPIRIGGSMRWKWSDVETYIERGSTGSEAPDDPILKASRGS